MGQKRICFSFFSHDLRDLNREFSYKRNVDSGRRETVIVNVCMLSHFSCVQLFGHIWNIAF